MTAVLHTWGQNLSQHVHLHCLIPGGVLTDQQHWCAARSTYLFPVRALSRRFRGRMVLALRDSAASGALHHVTRKDEIAISDPRILEIEQGQVHFQYKDYRDRQSKILRLDQTEFIRRILNPVLPTVALAPG